MSQEIDLRGGGGLKQMTSNELAQSPNRRRRYVISKRLQQNFTFTFLFLGLFIAIGVLAGLWYFSAKEVNEYLYRTHLMPLNPWVVVFPIMLKTSLIFIIILFTTSFVLTRITFKRLSTKFKIFNTALEKICSDDLATPVAESGFTSLNEKLEETRLNLNRMITVLKSIQKEIKVVAAAPDYDETVLKDLESLSITFNNKLSNFKY